MSDVIVPTPAPAPRGENERRRSLLSLGAAAALHAAAIVTAAILISSGPSNVRLPPIAVDLLLSGTAAPADQPAVAQGTGPVAVVPASGPAAGAASTASAGAGDGFVIPTPRTNRGAATTAPSGPGFREAGGTTGGAASLPAVQSPMPGATLPAAQSGTGSGTGSGSTQHSGQGVTMTSPSAGAGSGTLDLSALDKAMAGSGTGTRGTGGAAGAGGSGGTAGGVTGSGTGGGVPGSAITGPGYTVLWDQPEASKGREVLKAVTPSVPAWVGKQGMTLSVTVSFTLGADGVLSGVTVEKSSGYADVDSEVVRAIRQWRFSTAPGAGPVRGLIPYKITSR